MDTIKNATFCMKMLRFFVTYYTAFFIEMNRLTKVIN